VTFDIDANGILNVSAKDQATGRTQSIRISGSTRLSTGERDRMVKEAERYAEDDRKRREIVEQLNNADAICYQGEKMLADFGERLPADMKSRIEAAMRETREAVSKKDAALATERAEKLKKELQEAGKVLYWQTKPTAGTGESEAKGEQPGSPPHGRVVDAEYEEKKKTG
jgi:molecular chaperone DnaK